MLDLKVVNENLQIEIDTFTTEVADRMLGQSLPFVADQLLTDADKLLGAITALQKAIDAALTEAGELEASELADLLNSIEIDGQASPIVAKDNGAGQLVLYFQLEELTSAAGLVLDAGTSLGLSAGAFDLAGDVAADLTINANFAVSVDTATGDAAFAPDEFEDEIMLAIAGEINFDIEADNALGFIDIAMSDIEPFDPEAPKDDLVIALGLDLKSGGQATTLSMDGRATLDFAFMAGAPDLRILPEFGANVFVEVTYSGADLINGDPAEGAFAIELRDVQFKLVALAGVLQDVFSTVSDILNTFPIGEIVDLLVKRLPVVDDLAPSSFDFDEDGKITLQDVITLISVLNPSGLPPAFGLIQGVILLAEVIDAVDDLAASLAEDGCFDIGTLRLTSEALDTIASGATFSEGAQLISSEDSDLQSLADLIAALEALHDYIGLDETGSGEVLESQSGELSSSLEEGGPFDLPDVGLSFPFLASPEALIQSLGSLILNGANAPAVSFVEFDLPPLEFNAYDEISIRFGPFIGYLFGTFYAGVDINIGYDSAGFGDNFDFLEGLYISPDLPDVTIDGMPKTPVGTVQLGVGVGGGLDIVIARVSVEGGLLGQIDVFLGGTGPGDNKARLSELGGCFFNDIAGRITAGIDLVFKFGFGFFSFTKKQSIAKVTLAQFNIDPCNPVPEEIMDELEVDTAGLAEDPGDGRLVLNVGDRADQRNLSDEADAELDAGGNRIGRAEEETFFVGLVPEDENNPAQPGEVAVFAFGIFQRFGGGEVALQTIVGAGGSRNDTLTVSASVNLDADLRGNEGDDQIVGGGGNDLLRGDNGNDQLDGDLGDDDLRGGTGNDILRGGAGADDIDGGAGFDQVDFSASTTGVMLIESASTAGLMIGIGGEAQGDTLRNVEHFIGSDFDDVFYGNRSAANIFESGAGNDVLVGGSAGDLFIGGLGADVLSGNRAGAANTGGDAASYVFSGSGVFINLPLGYGAGGEAQGDVFLGIEDFQLSRHADRFIGDDEDNLIDGYDGDDELEGGGGQDEVRGGVGDDTIHATGDGDTLDGGGFLNYRPDTDTLTYEKAAGSVVASLYDGLGFRAATPFLQDTITFAQYIGFNPDGENAILTRSSSDNPRTSSFENLTGSDFNDALIGDDRANEIRGGLGNDDLDGKAGNDLLIGGFGADTIDGGSGIDTADYRGSDAAVQANLNAGVFGQGGDAAGDELVNVENLIGSRYNDSLVGNALDNRLDPFQNVFFAVETMIGNGGVDTAVLDYAFDNTGASYSVFLNVNGAGVVSRKASGATQTQTVGSLNTIEQIEFYGSGGDDSVTSLAAGNDLINTGGGNDNILALNGNDQVFAGAGDDAVIRIATQTIDNGLYVGAGDLLRETFILDGGAGIDSLVADISYTDQSINWIGDAPGTGESSRSLSLEGGGVIRNFETLTGLVTGNGADFIGQRGDVNNIFTTNGGSDTVFAGLGIDSADGGADERVLPTAPLFAEIDTLIVDYSGQQGRVVNVDPLDPIDAQFDGVIRLQELDGAEPQAIAQVRHREFERIFLTGTQYNDQLVGADRNPNQTSGPAPGDILDGGDGNDSIQGLAGNDTLIGGEGRDGLNGGAGDDILIGGSRGGTSDDFDQLAGGTGADRFVIGDAGGLLYNGVEDGAQIFDFTASDGDVIQLSGSAADYRLEALDPIILSDRALYPHVLYVVDPVTGAERPVLSILSASQLSLTDDAFDYVPLSSSAGVLAEAPLELSSEIAGSAELTGWLWQSGAVSDADLIAALQSGSGGTGQTPPATLSSSLEEDGGLSSSLGEDFVGPSSIIRAEDIAGSTFSLIGNAISDFAVPLFELDNDFKIYNTFELDGDSAAAGVFFNMWGAKDGIVLSTGRVEDILGPNTNDGRFTQGPRPASQVTLDFENLGGLEGGTLYRALLPDIPGGIESLVLQDDGDLIGGASGVFSAFDLDALFFSNDQIASTAGLTRADANALTRLNVIDYSAAGIAFDPGYQRPGGTQSADLFGTANGMIDFGQATLETLDWNNISSPATAEGFMSFGEGGSIALSLTDPLETGGGLPTYLYVYEIGGQENLEGIGRVSAQPIGVEGDLSTDLGTPGIEGDTTTLRSQFMVDYNGKDGPVPGFAQLSNVPFFDVVVVSEELPERGGADLPDLITVRVNGVDVLLDGNGGQVTMNTLALSPYGDYAPELSLNLAGEGALANHLKADSYTSIYRVSGPVMDGMNTIEITVADRSDALLDTAVFLMPITDGVPINADPVARNDALLLSQTQTGTINLISGDGIDTDSDGDTLSVTGIDLVDANGAVLQTLGLGASTALANGLGTVTALADGTFTFAAAPGTAALPADTAEALNFAYAVSDGNGGTASAGVLVALAGLNDDPRAIGVRTSIEEDTVLAIDLSALGSDADGDPITFDFGSAENGKVSQQNGQFLYTPNADFYGMDTMSFEVLDGNGGTDRSSIAIIVNPVNDAPFVKNEADQVLEDRTLILRVVDLLANDIDPDGDPLDIIGVSATSGTVTIKDGGPGAPPETVVIVYAPDRDFNGRDDIVYTVGDGNGGETDGIVSVDVLPENDRPVGRDDSAATGAGSAVRVDVLDNDTDVDGDMLVVSDISQPALGRVTQNPDGSLSYDPDGAFDRLPIGQTALVGFDYVVSDGALDDTATVSIAVLGEFDSLNIFGTPGDDVLEGTEQTNNIFGFAGNDTMNGLGGDDRMEGNAGNDLMDGAAGNDRLEGGLGNDTLNGGPGDDILLGQFGDDTLDGGDGFDLASFEASGDRIVASLNLGTATGEGTDTLTGIEGLIGSIFNDRLVGDAGDNTLYGGDGDDELIGLGGDDTIFGEAGNDTLIGTGGNDTLFGGAGDDIIDGVGGADVLSGGAGNDRITGDVGLDTIDGGSGDDDIFGNFGTDAIEGGAGDDNIRAGGSRDFVNGGAGNDRLVGANGRDILWGGDGNDVLFGGFGGDNGDGIRDVFVFKSALNGGGGFDIIRDFEDTTDKLDLSESGYASFADVFADAVQVGANLEINFDFGGYLRINNFDISDFTPGDVLF